MPDLPLLLSSDRYKARMAIAAIATTSHLHWAAALAESAAAACPGAERVLLWVDAPAAVEFENTARQLGYDRVLAAQDLVAAEALAGMQARYSAPELCFALKPLLLREMLNLGFAATIYFDADVFVYADLGAIFETLASVSIALTPHMTEPLPEDDRLPRDFTILRAGAFNLGFIGVRDTPETRRFLDWWAARESRYGYVDPLYGWGGDQKWCDMVPALFDGVAVLKNPGYNVAYWNLPSRPLSQAQGRWFAGNEPLVFFHFSGFDPRRPGMLSKFQDRIDPSHDPLLSQLLSRYAATLSNCERRVSDILQPILKHDSAELATKSLPTPALLERLLADPLEEAIYASSVRVSPREVFAEPGERVVFQVEICNRGETPLWLAAHSDGIHGVGLTFRMLRGTRDVLVDDNPRCYYHDPVPGGKTATVSFLYRVPNEYGQFTLEFDLVHDGFRWFHREIDAAARVEIFAGVLREQPASFDTRLSVREQMHRGSRSEDVALPSFTTLQQFMPFHGAPFVVLAYRTILKREPDDEGLTHFTAALAEGRMRRWEVLGRLRLSAEGRQRRVRLSGLWPAVMLSVAYRIPLAGSLLALLARRLRLPAHLQDLAGDDRLMAQIPAAENNVR
jgi:hypothetical protein